MSHLGLHFRHYKDHTTSIEISQIKADLINLAISNGKPLACWPNRVSIMLEKKPNEVSVSKLRAVLLLEADFNVANKIIFNTQMILIMERRLEILREIIRGRKVQSVI